MKIHGRKLKVLLIMDVLSKCVIIYEFQRNSSKSVRIELILFTKKVSFEKNGKATGNIQEIIKRCCGKSVESDL